MPKKSLFLLLPLVMACKEKPAPRADHQQTSKTANAEYTDHLEAISTITVSDSHNGDVLRREELLHYDAMRSQVLSISISWVEGRGVEGRGEASATVQAHERNERGIRVAPKWTLTTEADGIEHAEDYFRLRNMGCCGGWDFFKYYDYATGQFLGRSSETPTKVSKDTYLLVDDQAQGDIGGLPDEVGARLYLFRGNTSYGNPSSRLLDSIDVQINTFDGKPCRGSAVEKLTPIRADSLSDPTGFKAEASCGEFGTIEASFEVAFPPSKDRIEIRKDSTTSASRSSAPTT